MPKSCQTALRICKRLRPFGLPEHRFGPGRLSVFSKQLLIWNAPNFDPYTFDRIDVVWCCWRCIIQTATQQHVDDDEEEGGRRIIRRGRRKRRITRRNGGESTMIWSRCSWSCWGPTTAILTHIHVVRNSRGSVSRMQMCSFARTNSSCGASGPERFASVPHDAWDDESGKYNVHRHGYHITIHSMYHHMSIHMYPYKCSRRISKTMGFNTKIVQFHMISGPPLLGNLHIYLYRYNMYDRPLGTILFRSYLLHILTIYIYIYICCVYTQHV